MTAAAEETERPVGKSASIAQADAQALIDRVERLPKPDDTEYKAKMSKLDGQIAATSQRLEDVKARLSAIEAERRAESAQEAKVKRLLNDETARYKSLLVSAWRTRLLQRRGDVPFPFRRVVSQLRRPRAVPAGDEYPMRFKLSSYEHLASSSLLCGTARAVPAPPSSNASPLVGNSSA